MIEVQDRATPPPFLWLATLFEDVVHVERLEDCDEEGECKVFSSIFLFGESVGYEESREEVDALDVLDF